MLNNYQIMRLLTIVFIFFSITSKAQIAVGLFAGFDQSKFSGDVPREFTYEFKSGYVAGLTFDFGVGEKMFISIRPNITQNGANISIPDQQYQPLPVRIFPKEDTLYLHPITNQYVALPVIYQIYVSRAFYANSGLELSYNLSSIADINGQEVDLKDGMNDFLLNAIFGFGFSIPIGRTSLNLEFTYAQSLNTITKTEEIDDGSAPRLRTRRFRFSTYFTVFASKKTL